MAPSVAETQFRDNRCCPNSVTVATSNHYYGCKPREEKRKESFLLLLFYVFSVTWQGSFKCDFTNLKCNFLYCIISLVFRIPLISFLCKCLKSTRIYQVALNAFYKETLNNATPKKCFSYTQRFSLLAYIILKENVGFVFHK